jgi:hypothetical protein
MLLATVALLASHYVGAALAVALLIAGVLLMTGTEMLSSAGEWVVSFEFADDRHRGKYLSVFSMGGSLEGALGPSVATALLTVGAGALWPALTAIICAGLQLTAIQGSLCRPPPWSM